MEAAAPIVMQSVEKEATTTLLPVDRATQCGLRMRPKDKVVQETSAAVSNPMGNIRLSRDCGAISGRLTLTAVDTQGNQLNSMNPSSGGK